MDRNKEIDAIQSEQYSFPYHYIPSADSFPMFHKHWEYAASYIAGLKLAREWLSGVLTEKGSGSLSHMDFGCGDGGFVHLLSRTKGFEQISLAGVDLDERAIEWARMFSRGSDAEFICGDLFDLAEGSYDSGTLVEVFEHIPPSEADRFVDGLSRALKPKAPMFVTVPSNQVPVTEKHYRHFGFDDLAKCFEGRFRILRIFGFEKRTFWVRKLHRLLVRKRCYIETAATSQYIIRKLQEQHDELAGCGRIGLSLVNA